VRRRADIGEVELLGEADEFGLVDLQGGRKRVELVGLGADAAHEGGDRAGGVIGRMGYAVFAGCLLAGDAARLSFFDAGGLGCGVQQRRAW